MSILPELYWFNWYMSLPVPTRFFFLINLAPLILSIPSLIVCYFLSNKDSSKKFLNQSWALCLIFLLGLMYTHPSEKNDERFFTYGVMLLFPVLSTAAVFLTVAWIFRLITKKQYRVPSPADRKRLLCMALLSYGAGKLFSYLIFVA